MKESNTRERLQYYMSEFGIKQMDIIEKCKPYCNKYGIALSKSALSLYLSGKVEPKQDKIFILAKGLHVSEAWLMGFDVPMEPPSKEKEDRSKLKLLLSYLNDEGRRKVFDYISDLIDNPKYLKEGIENEQSKI